MAKSLKSKRKKRLRTLRREIVEPFYDKKDEAKLKAQEAALNAPKLPVRMPKSRDTNDNSMDLVPTLTSSSSMVVPALTSSNSMVYAEWSFARMSGIGWGWVAVIWVLTVITYIPQDVLKFITRYLLSGKAWDNLFHSRTAFASKNDYGKGEREAQWAVAQRTLHGLRTADTLGLMNDKSDYRELSEIAELAKKRTEVARIREASAVKGHVESVVKSKGLDMETVQQNHTV